MLSINYRKCMNLTRHPILSKLQKVNVRSSGHPYCKGIHSCSLIVKVFGSCLCLCWRNKLTAKRAFIITPSRVYNVCPLPSFPDCLYHCVHIPAIFCYVVWFVPVFWPLRLTFCKTCHLCTEPFWPFCIQVCFMSHCVYFPLTTGSESVRFPCHAFIFLTDHSWLLSSTWLPNVSNVK